MKKLLSVNYSAGAFNTAMLFLRITLGVLMMYHGYDKLTHFEMYKAQFIDFLGIGKTVSLSLAVFSEFFCSFFIILGLFTRLATIPLIISSLVALGKAHNWEIFANRAGAQGELITLFLIGYIVLLLIGPGRVSVDSMTGK